ncbi:HesA/MoeB/ThiF family protein [Roseovarius salinarum]|uniref:HesA/MoeB/ThiF family protein n=1 Tax=Roseovarius salinarum TaxID=1981892 RepID=UPI000C32F4CA|nr:molybdopterin-synthase adenylyltransferase MoeB [Roseovarius salinarum]
MALVLVIAAGLWGLGAVMGTPRRHRWAMIGGLWAAVVVMQLGLPLDHGLRQATGGSPAPWLILGGGVALVLGYRSGLRYLRARAAAPAGNGGPRDAPAQDARLSPTELERYARHIVLREIGGPGQTRLKRARVLVIGAGGLGSPALLYLGAAGVGTLGVIDGDVVENANLQRQVIHRDDAIGRPKVQSAAEALQAQNPFVAVRPYNRRLTAEIAGDLFADYDLVLDGSDNFETRYTANAAAHAAGVPLISGALSQWEGQLTVFDTARGTPCYECIFPEAPAEGLAPSCAEAGVLGPLPGILGTMMAAEAIKIIAGAGTPLRGTMLIHDALHGESRRITLAPQPGCPVCGGETTAAG